MKYIIAVIIIIFILSCVKKRIAKKNNYLEEFEKKIGASYPQELKSIISSINSVKIELEQPDQNYEILPILQNKEVPISTNLNVYEIREQIIKNCYKNKVESEFNILPFARSTRGDKLYYLFIKYSNKEPENKEVFIANIDSYDKPFLYSNNLNFILGEIIENNEKSIIKFQDLNLEKIKNYFPLFKKITREDDSQKIWINKSETDKFKNEITADLGAKKTDFGMATFYLQVKVQSENKIVSFGTNYLIYTDNISNYISHTPKNIEYNDLTYSLKLRCLIDLLNTFIEENEEDKETIKLLEKELSNISISKFANLDFNYIGY